MTNPAEVPAGDRRLHSGVIHDIGYRHYDGPRLGRPYIVRSLFLDSLRAAYGLGRAARSKVMPLLLLAAICLPALIISVIVSVTHLREVPGGYPAYQLNLQLLIAIYVAAQAPAEVSRDLRFRVMPLYFSRPMQRADYVLAKYAAMTAATFIFIALPLTILFVGALLAKLPLGAQLPDYLRSLGGALLAALLVAALGLVIAAITPRRGLGIAAIITVLVVLAGVQGTVQSIGLNNGRQTVAEYAGLLSPFSLVDGVQSALLGAPPTLEASPPGIGAGLVFLAVAVLVIAGCIGALLLRYRKVAI
jgi:ABC-2 type transport system permease protein